jgi:hypothetical protein
MMRPIEAVKRDNSMRGDSGFGAKFPRESGLQASRLHRRQPRRDIFGIEGLLRFWWGFQQVIGRFYEVIFTLVQERVCAEVMATPR